MQIFAMNTVPIVNVLNKENVGFQPTCSPWDALILLVSSVEYSHASENADDMHHN